MTVLSLFDGMSCGQIALNKLGIKYEKYYASEIDKYAIQVTQKNYPNTIQLGDVTKVKGFKVDLLIGGSPCQGFSFAGKGLNFDDPRSKLFFEYVRLLRECKPTWFLLENVKMKKEWQDVISSYVGVEPIEIDSALVSGQSRKRLYWTNVQGVTQPDDKGILLSHVICDGIVDRNKSYCLDASYFKGGNLQQYFNKSRRQLVFTSTSMTKVGYFGTDSQANRVYWSNGKAITLCGEAGGGAAKMGQYLFTDGVRKLTPVECERLQTVPDGYTEGVSDTQRYKMLGNGWTVDVICHILKGIL